MVLSMHAFWAETEPVDRPIGPPLSVVAQLQKVVARSTLSVGRGMVDPFVDMKAFGGLDEH